jgi:DNA-binding winged helix-turn-helix (wHTH) protein/tetratricopeptide (TPR) repeat protein
MPTANSTKTISTEYRFGRFRMNPRGRELWQGDGLIHAPRLVFDCLAYLLEHRDRVVGPDELVSAVWGRIDVADAQVRQLIARVRQLLGDSAIEQCAIRTVSGVGYRWVMDVVAGSVSASDAVGSIEQLDGREVAVAAARDSDTGMVSVSFPEVPALLLDEPSPPPSSAAEKNPVFRQVEKRWLRRIAAILACIAALFGAVVVVREYSRSEAPTPKLPASAAAHRALGILPLDVDAPAEFAWVRLGAMDLVANRIRNAGVPVTPSDSVVSAVHAAGEPLDASRLATLNQTLQTASLVQGSAIKSASGWTVKLATTDTDGGRHAAEVERPDITDAARQAADLLLAAMGHTPSSATEEHRDDLQELLQRAEAALLANQFDTARSILSNLPDALRNDARIRLKFAQVEQRSGKLDKAQLALTALLDDPTVKKQPSLHAQVLTSLGFIGMRRNDCVGAERYFDAALDVLPDRHNGLEAGSALSARGGARACLQHVEAAVADLAEAGPILEGAGDRLGVARLNNHLGLAEYDRHRPADALLYLKTAAALHELLGATDDLRLDLGLLTITQTQLLLWPEALATSARLKALSERIDNPAALYMMAAVRARILIRMGRYGEAGSLLRTTENAQPNVDLSFTLGFREAQAELAWAIGDPRQTMVAIDRAWEILPPEQMRDDEDVATILLRQRASIAVGDPVPARPPGTGLPINDDSVSRAPAFLVAQAEWAVHQGRSADAETGFRQATAGVDAESVPGNTVMVADAYARWLVVQQRLEDARAVAGRILPWADRDFDCALLQVAVFHALDQRDAWARALRQAKALAGERRIPAALDIALPR